jgi:hypothetical protein
MNTIWDQNLNKELTYWEWTAKALVVLGTHELAGRDDPNRPFDPFVESLIQAPEGSPVRVLDVGSGPLSPLGRISKKFQAEVVGVDALAEEYWDLMNQYGIGINSPLRPRYGMAEHLDSIFLPQSFDAVVAFNSIDHSKNPVECLNQMIGMMKPEARAYVWCYWNEGTYEHHNGIHQWDVDLLDGTVFIRGCGEEWILSEIIRNGIVEKSWFDSTTVKPTVHFILRRKS